MFWLAFLVGMGGLYMYNSHEFHKAEETFPPTGQFVTADSVSLHYFLAGSGQPVVFLHGNGGQAQDFTMSVFDLAEKSQQFIAFDRPGHGYSQRPADEPATVQVQARLIHDALEKLGVKNPILVGHSWSGALVMDYAVEYPGEVRGLVLLGGYMYPEEGYPPEAIVPEIPVLGDLLVHTLLIPVGRYKQATSDHESYYPDEPPDSFRVLSETMALRPDEMKATADDERTIDRDLEAIVSQYAQVKVPTVIVTGDQDKVVNPDLQSFRLHREIPQSRLIVLHNVGHAIQWSDPGAVIDAIDMILDGDAPSR